jgi:hypothetical protein|tara:strand:- start:498 stop:887 length:390 start_codon:yes stop_codon:yes gene_type:complete
LYHLHDQYNGHLINACHFFFYQFVFSLTTQPDKIHPFGAQSDLNAIYVTSQDVSAQNNAENPKFKKIFSLLKKDFEEGRIMGIGELFLNTSTNKKKAKMRHKADINSPAMKALFALSNKHNGVITFHTE